MSASCTLSHLRLATHPDPHGTARSRRPHGRLFGRAPVTPTTAETRHQRHGEGPKKKAAKVRYFVSGQDTTGTDPPSRNAPL